MWNVLSKYIIQVIIMNTTRSTLIIFATLCVLYIGLYLVERYATHEGIGFGLAIVWGDD